LKMWMPCHLTVTKEECGCVKPEDAVCQERENWCRSGDDEAKRELYEYSRGKAQGDLRGVERGNALVIRCGVTKEECRVASETRQRRGGLTRDVERSENGPGA